MKNKITIYIYRIPDNRWEIFGGKDFKSFADRFVVKGLFHNEVLEAVVES